MSNSIDQLYLEAMRDAKHNKYDPALKKLQQLRREHPAEEVSIAIGNLYFHQEKFDEAIRYYKEAVQRNSRNQTARWNWEVALKKQTPANSPPAPPQPENAPVPEQRKIPNRTESLLQYFDQLEKEQMQQQNRQNANKSEFAW